LYAGLSGSVNDGAVNEFVHLQTFALQARAEGASQRDMSAVLLTRRDFGA